MLDILLSTFSHWFSFCSQMFSMEIFSQLDLSIDWHEYKINLDENNVERFIEEEFSMGLNWQQQLHPFITVFAYFQKDIW